MVLTFYSALMSFLLVIYQPRDPIYRSRVCALLRLGGCDLNLYLRQSLLMKCIQNTIEMVCSCNLLFHIDNPFVVLSSKTPNSLAM